MSDPEKRPTVMDLLRGVGVRVYPVGRLDYASEGLLLLSNDGELAAALMKASSHVPKTYLVKVAGTPSVDEPGEAAFGCLHPIAKAARRRRPRRPRSKPIREADNPWYEVTLIEGKNRQIRRMFETSAITWRKSSACATDRCSSMCLRESSGI